MQKYINIENSSIPLLGLGTWQLNGKECEDTVDEAINMGYRHLDTAQNYQNEADVGTGVKKSKAGREELFITTKVSTENLKPDALIDSTKKSLEKLQSGYIDLLLIHWPTSDMNLKETLDAMFTLKEQGKIKNAGVSNFSPVLFREAISLGPVICNQVEFSPFIKQDNNLAVAKEADLMITAYSPLGRGKVSKDQTLREIGMHYEKTAAQVTLRWLLQQGNVSVIPKASGLKHLQENIEVFDFELTTEDMEKISRL